MAERSHLISFRRHYTGPQKSSPEHKGSSQRNYSRGPYSPAGEFEDDSHSKYISDHNKSKMNYDRDMEDSELLRNDYRRPRDILLYMVAEFLTKSTTRLAELNKKPGGDGKTVELLDTRAHIVSTRSAPNATRLGTDRPKLTVPLLRRSVCPRWPTACSRCRRTTQTR